MRSSAQPDAVPARTPIHSLKPSGLNPVIGESAKVATTSATGHKKDTEDVRSPVRQERTEKNETGSINAQSQIVFAGHAR